MKKKISLPIVISVVLIVAAVAFSAAYMIATAAINAKLTDLGEKQAMFSTLSDVDSYVREKSYYDANEEYLASKLCEGYAEGYEGRVLYLTAEEYENSDLTPENGYTVLVLADRSAMVVLTQEQYELLYTAEPAPETQSDAETE